MNLERQRLATYQSSNPLAPDLEKFFKKLVPISGGTQYLESECLRAATRLNYEWLNNGGGNKKGHEVNFLLRYGSICGLSQSSVAFLKENIAILGSQVLWPNSFETPLDIILEEIVAHLAKIEKEGRTLMPGSFDLLSDEYDFDEHDFCYECRVDCTANNLEMTNDMCNSCYRISMNNDDD